MITPQRGNLYYVPNDGSYFIYEDGASEKSVQSDLGSGHIAKCAISSDLLRKGGFVLEEGFWTLGDFKLREEGGIFFFGKFPVMTVDVLQNVFDLLTGRKLIFAI